MASERSPKDTIAECVDVASGNKPPNASQNTKPTCDPKEEQLTSTNRRYIGILLTLFAALFFSCSALIIKLLNFHPLNLGVWRSSAMLCVTFPFLLHGYISQRKSANGMLQQIWPLTSTVGLLILQAVLSFNSILLVFYGLSYQDIGDSIVISTSAPVFVTIVACLILREKFGFVSCATAILAFFGVFIICKPPVLTGSDYLDNIKLKGVACSMASMFLLTFSYVLIRYLRKVHYALIQVMFALWGILESLPIALAFNVLEPPSNCNQVALIIATALLSFSAQTCITLALKYEQAGIVSMVRTMEVVFCYFWQFWFLNERPDMYSAIGAMIVVFCVILAATRNMLMALPENHVYKVKCKCLLV